MSHMQKQSQKPVTKNAIKICKHISQKFDPYLKIPIPVRAEILPQSDHVKIKWLNKEKETNNFTMDYKVLRQNDKISSDVDPEKPKIDSEDVRKEEKHSPHEEANCVQFEKEFIENSLEAVSLESRSTILEGKSKYVP